MSQKARTKATRGESYRNSPEGPVASDCGVPGTGVALMRMQDDLLAPIFWLALGCALGWQDKECYEGENPEALVETATSHA
jgi:hypothetical protein